MRAAKSFWKSSRQRHRVTLLSEKVRSCRRTASPYSPGRRGENVSTAFVQMARGSGSIGHAPGEALRVEVGVLGAVERVAAAPAAPVRAVRDLQSVRDEGQPGGRVALHAVGHVRIRGAERPVLLLDVPGQPGVADRRVVDPLDDAVDGGPRPVPVAAGAHDVEELRELRADPDARVVLVGDRVDAQLADEALDLLRAARLADPVERLGQGVRARPTRRPTADGRPRAPAAR